MFFFYNLYQLLFLSALKQFVAVILNQLVFFIEFFAWPFFCPQKPDKLVEPSGH